MAERQAAFTVSDITASCFLNLPGFYTNTHEAVTKRKEFEHVNSNELNILNWQHSALFDSQVLPHILTRLLWKYQALLSINDRKKFDDDSSICTIHHSPSRNTS